LHFPVVDDNHQFGAQMAVGGSRPMHQNRSSEHSLGNIDFPVQHRYLLNGGRDGVERKLAAILAADVVGYSRLMEADEAGTLAALNAHRKKLIEPTIAENNGRVVKLMGDGVLVEFASVVEAVTCALTVQDGMTGRNEDVTGDRRIVFRIGVHLGDVMVEDNDLYGDGVNVAARLEALAEPGEICISQQALDQVETKLDLAYEDLGKQQVKNIVRPIHAWQVQREGQVRRKTTAPRRRIGAMPLYGLAVVAVMIAVGGVAAWWHLWKSDVAPNPAPGVTAPFPDRPDRPAIAVLPFDNISGDPEQEYFADGMAEDIITDLSKISGLFVIARNSSFAYKDNQTDVRTIARELGVRYVLEGSVRRAGDNVRINAQLVDAGTGGHLWAERYDGERQDVFALQDSVTERIVSALAVQLTAGEKAQVTRRETLNIAAYDAFLQGWEHYRRRTPGDFAKAADFFEQAVSLDPQYGRAYAALAIIYWKSWVWSVQTMSPSMQAPWTRRLNIPVVYAPERAEEYLQKAMQFPTPLAHQVASEMRWRNRQYNEAIAEAKRAIALNTNDSAGYVAMAEAMIFGGQPKEAVKFIEKAIRLDPHSAANLYILGLARFSMGQLDQAATLFERALQRSPLSRSWKAPLAAAYAHIGQDEKAQAAIGDYGGGLYTVRDIMDLWPFSDTNVVERFAIGIVKAGVCCEENLRHYLDDLRRARKD
jgi:TolB-like protein/class 3 adenylate cyclase